MQRLKRLRLPVLLATAICAASSLRSEGWLNDAPNAPTSVPAGNSRTPHLLSVTGGFNVDTASREQVRSFYNAVYHSSDGVPIASTANISTCTPGTNSSAFQNAGAAAYQLVPRDGRVACRHHLRCE